MFESRGRSSSANRPLKRSPFLFVCTLVLFSLFCVLVGSGTGLALGFYGKLPTLAPLEDYRGRSWSLPTRVYSRNGSLIASFSEEQRHLVGIRELPSSLIRATLAVEDRRFFQHSGIDFQGILRAAVENLRAGRIVEGGSTITQQLAKVLFLNPRRTFRRKFKEALLALRIERRYTKRQILERYFNKIYFGAGAYGVGAASRVYFDKPVRRLTLAESALLAGLPRAPSYYSPFNHPEVAKDRHRLVLEVMVRENLIAKSRARRSFHRFWEEFEHRTVGFQQRHDPPGDSGQPSYFVDHVRRRLIDSFGSKRVYRGGMEVYTTVDRRLQNQLSNRISTYLLKLNKNQGNLADTATRIPPGTDRRLIEGAMLLRTVGGEVRAVVGGHRWYSGNPLNRALQSRRQPGSAFKPVLYALALRQGYTPSTPLQDRPLVFQTSRGRWIPNNYGREYHGRVTLRTALIHSYNVATVDLMRKIGPGSLVDFARELGITSPLNPHLSLALGGLRYGVTLKEMIDAYAVFANRGIRTGSIFIRRVRGRRGNVLLTNVPRRRRVLTPQTAYVMTDLLKSVVETGTGRSVGRRFSRPIAGKTGTTTDYRDAWFIGYTPGFVMGTWFGYDRARRSMGPHMTGSVVAGSFWKRAYRLVVRRHPPRNFAVPRGIDFARVDPETGRLSSPECRGGIRVAFRTGNVPTRRCESPSHRGAWLTRSSSPGRHSGEHPHG